MQHNTKLIEIKNLKKSFGDKEILNGISLDIYKGKSLVIVGASGSGKSVLIKNIAMILSPDSGDIIINGTNITSASKQEKESIIKRMGYLFQAGALFDSLTIWENIAFRLLQDKINRHDAKEQAALMLEEVELDSDILDLKPQELSGGMQKRVALARAIISKPDIIFLDEPTTGLDPVTAETIDNLIIKLSKKIGATTITVTHDLASIKKTSD
ncbi:MAG: ATP-binding cassette domain-containing protein, partial [Rickettsiales bacterium]|nr:ATP-binding cassette domain-containing protein [Rickettsiales bacterium]